MFLKQQETYASIHKGRNGQSEGTVTQRRNSKDEGASNNGFGASDPLYGTYTSYGRPQVQTLFLSFKLKLPGNSKCNILGRNVVLPT